VAAIASPLRRFPNDVLVEGHTDNVPLTRPGYTNWNLSTDRAVAVLSLLYGDLGIAQQRLGAAGYGEHRPLVPNNSDANRALNRRVDVLIVAEGI
jgi:chemotaxis protein MotB